MNIYSYNWQEKFYIHVYVCAHTRICSNKNHTLPIFIKLAKMFDILNCAQQD